MQHLSQTQARTERKGEKRNQHRPALLQERSHIIVEITQQHTDHDRDDHRHERDERNAGDSRRPKRYHGEKRAIVDRNHRNRADIGFVAELTHQRRVQPTVGVGHRRDDRKRRQTEHPVVAEDRIDQEADRNTDEKFRHRHYRARLERSRCGAYADARTHTQQKRADERTGSTFEQCGGESPDLERLGSEGVDHRPQQERNHHHAAGNTLDRWFYLHRIPPRYQQQTTCHKDTAMITMQQLLVSYRLTKRCLSDSP